MGMWYKRTEAQKRFSFFFSSTTLAGAFGGLLATGLGKMQGLRGYNGWRWIFIIEGLITCVVASLSFFIIPDFPEEVKWLNDEEREFIKAKLARDVGKSAHNAKLGLREFLGVFKDCKSIPMLQFHFPIHLSDSGRFADKIFIGGLMYFGLIVPAYSEYPCLGIFNKRRCLESDRSQAMPTSLRRSFKLTDMEVC